MLVAGSYALARLSAWLDPGTAKPHLPNAASRREVKPGQPAAVRRGVGG